MPEKFLSPEEREAYRASSHPHVTALLDHAEAADARIAELEAALAELTRELPCGSHPRLMSLGKPARFKGGCGKPVIAAEAIFCADCMAWFCSPECARRHFSTRKAMVPRETEKEQGNG